MERLNKIFRLVINSDSSDGEKLSGIKRIQEYIKNNNKELSITDGSTRCNSAQHTDYALIIELAHLKDKIEKVEQSREFYKNKAEYNNAQLFINKNIVDSQKIQIGMLEKRIQILNSKQKSAYRICAFISFIVFLICVLVATVFKDISVNLNGTDLLMISSFCILLIFLFIDEIK